VATVPYDNHNQSRSPFFDAERIVACVNFCRQFSTEYLKQREMFFLKPGSELIGKSMAEIEGFEGMVALTLVPVVKT
jgi:hypothetical protein